MREFLRGAVEHDVAAALAGTRPDVEDAVGGEHDLRIVLHHHQRVAAVAQSPHDLDDAPHVARVQADGRFVEHEQGVHQRRAEGRGEVDALHLAAGQGARLPVQGEIAEAHLAQVAEAGADLGQQKVGRLVQRRRQLQACEEVAAALDRQQHDVVHREARQRFQQRARPRNRRRQEALRRRQHALRIVRRAEPPQQRDWLEAAAFAGGAGRVGPVLGEQHPDVHLVALGFEPVEEAAHAVPGSGPGLAPVLPVRFALQHPAALLRREFAPWHVHRYAALVGIFVEVALGFPVALGLPRFDRAAAQGLGFVRHDEAVVDADRAPEAAAGLAGADGRVEGEQAGRRLGVVDVAVGAVQVGGELPGRRRRAGIVQRVHGDAPLAHPQRRLQRLDHPHPLGRRHAQAVLHHLQRVAAAGVEARVALRLQQLQHFLLAEIVRNRHREGDHQPRVAGGKGTFGELGADRIGRVAPHRPAAAAAEELRGPREQQLQVVVQLRHGADRGARGAHRVGLVDGDGRRDAGDGIHLRLVHAVEELPRVGREGLDIAPLALGVERVEHERRLARTRDPGDDDQLVQRDAEVEILEVVLAGAADEDGVGGVG